MSSAIALNPDIQGIASHIAEGKLAEAQQAVEHLLATQPDNAMAVYLKGMIHSQQGDEPNARQCYQQASRLQSDFAETCFAYAGKLEETGHIMLAMNLYKHLLTILPSHKKLHRMAAKCLDGLRNAQDRYYNEGLNLFGQGHYEQAVARFRSALALQPDRVDVLYVLGLTLYNIRHYAEAEEFLARGLQLQPGHMDSLNVMGCIYHMRGEYDKALEYYRKSLAIQPDYIITLGNIGCMLADAKRYNEAIAAYEEALRFHPDAVNLLMELVQWKRRTCNWDGLKEYEDRLIERIMVHKECATPFNIGVYFESSELQLANARQWSDLHYPNAVAYDTKRPLPATVRQDKRLRIGYMSGDFNDHATAYLISELFELYDREHFEIFAYSTGNMDESPAGIRMRSAFNVIHDMAPLTSEEGAQKIRDDEIDVLVDLSGYTNKHRIDILANHPAPVQIEYLAFPMTTGTKFIDYYISDHVVTPPGYDKWFTEALIRLPYSYQINDRKRHLPVVVEPRGNHGLPEGAVVFCAANGEFKNTLLVFEIWMRLLKEIEGSVLWLYAPLSETQANIRMQAQQHGMDPARIIFATGVPNVQHLTRIQCADLFLDTFPCTGHTTISDALWVGLPAVTIAGDCFSSRVAASLLHAVGLPELSTSNLHDYEKLALELARNSKYRNDLKEYLRKGRMTFPLFNSPNTVRAIEVAYKHVAAQYRAGHPPKAFDITKDFEIVAHMPGMMAV